MSSAGFVDIRSFWIRTPVPGYLYPERKAIERDGEVKLVEGIAGPDLAQVRDGWLGVRQLSEHFPAKFSQRNPLNLPGPIYGADTDTCESGLHEAPHNVLLDQHGQEFVFKQAATAVEFRCLVRAALCECFSGYGADGDAYWRLTTIREWWRTRGELLRAVESGTVYGQPASIEHWKRMLQGAARPYLQVYAFFVENGRVPKEGDLQPDIE